MQSDNSSIVNNNFLTNENALPPYEAISKIGSGSFGYVLEVYDHQEGKIVAIKRLHKIGTKLSREYDILSKITENKNIIKLENIFFTTQDSKKIIQNMVMEYSSITLDHYFSDLLKKQEKLDIKTIKYISYQLLSALQYIHKKNIVHRDLKPENILIDKNNIIKICDFGSSKIICKGQKSTPYIVSRYYRAPELILGEKIYDGKIDIFSAGCIIAELFTLDPIFKGYSEGSQLLEYLIVLENPGRQYFTRYKDYCEKILNILDDLGKIYTYDLVDILDKNRYYDSEEMEKACDLIKKLLCLNQDNRITAEESLNHPFLKEICD